MAPASNDDIIRFSTEEKSLIGNNLISVVNINNISRRVGKAIHYILFHRRNSCIEHQLTLRNQVLVVLENLRGGKQWIEGGESTASRFDDELRIVDSVLRIADGVGDIRFEVLT